MLHPARRRLVAFIGLIGAGALVLSSCAQSDRGSGGGGGGASGGTLNIGAAGAPKLFDPFYATDGETFRITQQIFDNLVTFKPGTTEVVPQLATKWTENPDGKTWTFDLRKGVKFTDGTPFNADAVCKNFQRMYSQTGAGQSDAVSQYWVDNFGGFSDGKAPSLYSGCQAKGDASVDIKLTRPSSKFPDILGLASWAMQSPTAMDKYHANEVKTEGDSFQYSDYAENHPTGSGPFKFVKFDKANNTVELDRNDQYWGPKPKLDKIIFKIYKDTSGTKQALDAGEIDGYDLPQPQDMQALTSAGDKLLPRKPFNLMYLFIDQKNNPKLQDLRVRQAIAYAINRPQLVKSQYPQGAEVAKEFLPTTMAGYNPNVMDYNYDPNKAKQLLAAAGAQNLSLSFMWPSEVSRPYMPSPKDQFTAIKDDLQAVGIKVNEKSEPWNGGYLDDIEAQKSDLGLMGWQGDFNAPDNFLANFFGSTTNRFYTKASPWGQQLADQLPTLDSTADKAARDKGYSDMMAKVMSDYLPGIPMVSSPSMMVTNNKVSGLIPSPMSAEKFNSVSVNK